LELNQIQNKNINNYQVHSKSQKTSSVMLETQDMTKAPNNPNYYRNYKGVNFKGHTFISDVKDTEKIKEVKLDGEYYTVKSYKKDDREYILTNDDKLYRVRYSKNPDKNAETVLASRLYNLAGIKTPEMKVFESNGMNGYVSEYTTGMNEPQTNPKALYESFGADAWLGNWNTYNHGNTQVDNEGNLVKIVTSGSLNYRASGKKKDKFDTNVNELETLRNPQINPQGAELLKGMTDEDLKNSLQKVTDIKTNDIILAVKQSQVSDKQQMIDTLIGRRNFIKSELNKLQSKQASNVENYAEQAETTIEEVQEDPAIRKRKSEQLDKYLAGEYIYKDSDEWWMNRQKEMVEKVKKEVQYDPEKRKIFEDILDISFHEYEDYRRLAYKNNLEQFTGYDIEQLKCVEKLAHYQKFGYSLPLNEPNEYRKLENIPTEKLNYMVNKLNLTRVDDILQMDKNNLESIKTSINLGEKYEIQNSLVENIIKFATDETGTIPDYKMEMLETLLEKDDIFKEPYGSYHSDGPRCLASDILKLCTDKETTQKILNNIMPDYETIVEKYDRNSVEDIKELLNSTDKDFDKEKIIYIRNKFPKLYDSDYRQNFDYIKTHEDFDVFKDLLRSGLSLHTTKHLMFWAQSEIDNPDGSKSKKYDYPVFDFAKKLHKDGFKPDLFDDLTFSYIQARRHNYPEKEKEIIKDAEIIKTSGLTQIMISDRIPPNNPSYWPNSTNKRYLFKEEIYFLKDLPKDKLDRVKECIEIEGRKTQFEFQQLYDIANLDYENYELAKELAKPLPNGEENSTYAIFGYLDFKNFNNVENINELNINEKRELLKKLVKHNSNLFAKDFQNLINTPILPRNKDEYCSLMNSLVNSIYLQPKPISEETKANYFESLKNLDNIYGEFLNLDLTKEDVKLDLAYPRDKFKSDIEEKLSNLSDKDRKIVTNYFGFEIKKDETGFIKMSGYPVDNNQDNSEYNYQINQAIEDIRPLIKAFSEENKILPNKTFSPELVKDLNNITHAFPELFTIIGTKQHDTHSYTVDIHTLNVLQNIMKNPKYQYLPEDDKRTLQTVALFHDLTKMESVIDKTHPAYSAYDAYHITQKLEMPEKQNLQIYQLIRNHDFLEHFNKRIYLPDGSFRLPTDLEKENTAKNYAFELKYGNNLKMASILTEADLKSVSRDGYFYKKFGPDLAPAEKKIAKYIDNIQKTAIHLPQTDIPKASELKTDHDVVQDKITFDSNGDIVKNKVIFLRPGVDLQKYGFKEDIKSDDFNVLTHGLDTDEQSVIFSALGQLDSDALLSTSYVNYKKGNYHVFRQQGFIVSAASEDIHAAYYRDFGSGCRKDKELLKKDYLFGGYQHGYREYISDELKKELHLTDEEYQKLYPTIVNKSIPILEKENPRVGQAFKNIIENMENGKRSHGRQYNEILITRPQIKAVFYQGKKNDGEYKLEDVPEFLRKYAEKNDIPIIYFGE